MSAVATYTWELVRGDDTSRVFTYRDANGNAVNLTGVTAALEITRNGAMSSVAGMVNAALGKVTVAITDTVTTDWSSNPTFKLRLTDGGGLKTTILAGNFEVTQ